MECQLVTEWQRAMNSTILTTLLALMWLVHFTKVVNGDRTGWIQWLILLGAPILVIYLLKKKRLQL